MPDLPAGTVTFLLTDIEGSTKLWEQYPEQMRAALARHDALAADVIARFEGNLVKSRGEGDSLFTVFARATDALCAALTLQQAFIQERWPAETPLRVRIALHTGEADLREGDYYGAAVNRCARLRAIGHGGQILLSRITHDLVRDTLQQDAVLLCLGEHRLRDLERPEQVFQLRHPDLPAEFPPLRSLDHPDLSKKFLPNNLPLQVTSFIGREKEIAEVKRLLATTSLLTLTGIGGCGKTRLSLQVAADMVEDYPDGIWWIELAPLSDPSLVPQSLAQALGVREKPGRALMQTLIEHLKSKQALLALDNCEHLLDACAQLTDTLLRSCPSIKLLASSREGLGIAGELTYRVPSLSLPDLKQTLSAETLLQFEAVRLFIERATFHLPAFSVTDRNAPALAQVCHRLDGIPLAIELAAARVRSLAIEEINTRLDNRFRLLTGGSRTALPRQQTLRALIDWSYDLLNLQERVLLHRLSVFMGGWTLDAAEFVCSTDEGLQVFRSSDVQEKSMPTSGNDLSPTGESNSSQPQYLNTRIPERLKESLNTRIPEDLNTDDVLDLLTSLVDKSLVIAEQQEGSTRYRLLETVRQYARDKLMESGEAEAVRRRHRDYFFGFAQEADRGLWRAGTATWLNRLEMEHDNLRAALQWCLEKPGVGCRVSGVVSEEKRERGREGEGEEKQRGREQGTDIPNSDTRHPTPDARHPSDVGLQMAGFLCEFWQMRGYWSEGREQLTAMLAQQEGGEPTRARAHALIWAGKLASMQGDYSEAHSHFEQSLAIYRELDHKPGMASAVKNLGYIARRQGEFSEARSFYEQSLRLNRETGARGGEASNLFSLGWVASEQGEYEQARSFYEQSLQINRAIDNRDGQAVNLYGLGIVARHQGDYARARSLSEQALVIHREIGNREQEAYDLYGLGWVAREQGAYEEASAYYEQAAAIHRELGIRLGEAYNLSELGRALYHQGDYAQARSYLEHALQICHILGDRSLQAYSLGTLGLVAEGQADDAEASDCYEQALAINREIGNPIREAENLDSLGDLACERQDFEQAQQLHIQALEIRMRVGHKRAMIQSLEAFAALYLAQQRCARAAQLYAAADSVRTGIGASLSRFERQQRESNLAAICADLGEEAYAAACAVGHAMTLEQAIEFALKSRG